MVQGGDRDYALETVATVNGLDISQREFAEELRRQQDQLRRMFGGAHGGAFPLLEQ